MMSFFIPTETPLCPKTSINQIHFTGYELHTCKPLLLFWMDYYYCITILRGKEFTGPSQSLLPVAAHR